MKHNILKIYCKKCHRPFEYGGNPSGSVEYQKCNNIFRIVYGIQIICPNCQTVIKPQLEGKIVIGVPVLEISKEKKLKDNIKINTSSEKTGTRRELLAKKFAELKKHFQAQDRDDETPLIRFDKNRKKELTIKKINRSIRERDRMTGSVSKTEVEKIKNRVSTEIRNIKPRKKTMGWHLKISKKQGKIIKKIGFSLVVLGIAVGLSQVLPELMASKVLHASSEEKNQNSILKTISNSPDEILIASSGGELNFKKLHELLNKKKIEEEKAKETRRQKKITELNDKSKIDKEFKRYIAGLNISSGFGFRNDPFNGKKRFHSGIDIPRKYRSPVKAFMSGKVIFSGYKGGYGNLVILKHKNGMTSYYGHNAKNTVLKGETVHKGKIISYVGMTGRTTGPHLHFEVRKNGKPIDPIKFVENLFKKYGRVTI